ncbi:cytochrome P450 [Trametes maxima]|nr:cytochrome P450 [Trametes maxima]
MFDLPKKKPWYGCRDLCAKHGDIVYLNVLGQHILVVGSAAVATELLEKRSANTGDRPYNPVLELSGQDLNPVTMSYGPWWRRHRRAIWQFFNPSVVSRYFEAQRVGAHKFIACLWRSPSRVQESIRYTFQGSILKVVYGIDVTHEEDRLLSISAAALEAIQLSTPGHFAVEALPFLRHVPAWFPGAGFQTFFAECKLANDTLKHKLFDDLKGALERGESRPSLAADLLASATVGHTISDLDPEVEEVMKNVCAVSTGHTLEAFCLAMALHPEVQKKAQTELDAVVGPHRLPNHSDSVDLVYISAMVKEILRWHVVAPVGVVHRTLDDDEINGYFIPAGTNIMANVWGILHDPEMFENPFEFRPERFIKDGKLNTSMRNPTEFMPFGFGRRICPGRYFALPSLFINIACLLHVFNIGPPLDESGKPMPIKHEQAHGLVSHVEDLRCTVKPRSAEAEALLQEIAREIGDTVGLA